MKFSNKHKLPLPIAIWLATDSYDHAKDTKTLSATTFTKCHKKIVLSSRVQKEEREKDLVDLLSSRIGTAIHDSIENSILDDKSRKEALKLLGIRAKDIDKIIVNPKEGVDLKDKLPIYMEKRSYADFGEYRISGKFDIVYDGGLADYKTTKTWKYNKLEEAARDYMIQGSIYRYLNQDIIKKDTLKIILIFLDWSKTKATTNKYPKAPVITLPIKLMSIEETEKFIKDYLTKLDDLKDKDEDCLDECDQKDLWQANPTYKYYKKGKAVSKRATATSTEYSDLVIRKMNDGGVGEIETVYGKARACTYCDARSICKQADRLKELDLLEE